ncbi:MAG: universal stress protein [Granulosicoccaceae bacterium]
MAYKTILLHFDDEAHAPALVKLASSIASQHEAHLIGLFVIYPFQLYVGQAAGVGSSGEFSSLLAKEQIERMKRIQQIFEEQTCNQNYVAEWRFIDERNAPLEDTVLQEASTADLLILGQHAGTYFTQEIVNTVLLDSPVPVLLVPKRYDAALIGQNVLVAWDGKSEAARAVGGALPMLVSAKRVLAHHVRTTMDEGEVTDLNLQEFSRYIARHGVMAEVSESTEERECIGKTIFNVAKDYEVDCVVMGAYGHSRARCLFLGSATEYAIANMSIPILMWH